MGSIRVILAVAVAALAGAACSFDESGLPAQSDGGIGDVDAAQSIDASASADAAQSIDANTDPDAPPPPDARPPDADPPDADPPDADPPDAPPPDDDMDGVPNDDDNCPGDANPDQHDEDGDTVGDVCDNCPGTSNPLQENVGETNNGNTADEVGDACDPRPDAGGDTIAFFDPFTGSAVSSDWDAIGGTWSVSGDELHQTGTASGGEALVWNGAKLAKARVVTVGYIDTIPPSTGMSDDNRTIGVVGQYDGSMENGYGCAIFDRIRTAGGVSAIIFEATGGASVINQFDFMNWAMATGADYEIELTVRDNTNTRQACRTRAAAGNGTVNDNDNSYSSGNLGVVTERLQASFKYVVIYALGG